MSLPLDLTGPASGLAVGTLFGFILQRAGLGDGCKLTGQLRLEDWTVFNVMFTAIIVAAGGLWILDATGYMPADTTYVPPALLAAPLVGGSFVGLGMAVGGYCPGTSVVAAFSGRLDGIVFFLGLVAGTLVFSGAYARIGPWMEAATPLPSATLSDLLRLPGWVVVALLALTALITHLLIVRSGRRAIPATLSEAQ